MRLAAVLVLVASACGSSTSPSTVDADAEPATVDASVLHPDAAKAPDATLPDAARPDAALPDAAIPDAALPDAPIPDAALPDVVIPDAGPDAGCSTDMCGICDWDPTNDCTQDCAGVWGGYSIVDNCGVCTPYWEACQPDCAGTWGGSAYVDNCGVCDADPADDCQQDCNGDWGGSAQVDECGLCWGGSSPRPTSTCQTADLTVVADATVVVGYASQFGLDPDWAVNGSIGYLRFDLSSLPGGAIVLGAKVTATEEQSVTSGADGNVYAHFVGDDGWDEATIDGTNAPSYDTGSNLGSWDPGALVVSDQTVSVSTPALTTTVANEFAGDRLLSLAFDSSGSSSVYHAKEGDPTKAAVLHVAYVVPTVTAFEPVSDSWVDKFNPDFVEQTYLPENLKVADADATTYLKFDTSSIPGNTVRVDAWLDLYAHLNEPYDTSGGFPDVVLTAVLDNSWDESTITYNNRPATDAPFTSWRLPDIGSNIDDKVEVGVGNCVKYLATKNGGSGIFSFAIVSTGYESDYYSRDEVTDSVRPHLYVSWY